MPAMVPLATLRSPRLVELADEADMVVGSRSANDVSSPLVRRPAKWVLRRLASYLAGEEIPVAEILEVINI